VIAPPPKVTEHGQNRRGATYHSGAARDKAAREEGFGAADGIRSTPRQPEHPLRGAAAIRLSITWHSPKRQWPDVLNWTGILKSHLDGIADSVGFNDALVLRVDYDRQKDKDDPRVELRFWAEPSAQPKENTE
jgi:hypothetical protein